MHILLNLRKFLHFSDISYLYALRGPVLRIHKNLVVYWYFGHPETQNVILLKFSKNHSFCENGTFGVARSSPGLPGHPPTGRFPNKQNQFMVRKAD